jgi:tRNA threonylcarbamoyladenosine biosynthesis protein TsaE
MKRYLENEGATILLAQELYGVLPERVDGWTILLRGELGAGKSTFARAFIRAAGHEGAVPSPTYTLVEPYDLATGIIYHIDLYRVSSEEELRFLGFSELEDGCRLVEWPERVPALAGQADLSVNLEYDGEGRIAIIGAKSARGDGLIKKIN